MKQWLSRLDDRCGGSESASVRALPPEIRNELVKLQFKRFQAQMPTLYPAVIIAVIIAAAALPVNIHPLFQLLVPTLFVIICLYWFFRWHRRRGIEYDAVGSNRQLNHIARMTTAFGVAIGLWSITILIDENGTGRSFVPVLIMTAASIAAHCMASIPRTAIVMIGLTTAPTIIMLISTGDTALMTTGIAVLMTSSIHCRLMLQYYRQMVSALKLNHHMLDQANTDVLTKLPNRRAFNTMFEAQFAGGDTTRPFGIAMIDLDEFKKVNDQCGHLMGDAMLRAVAERLDAYRLPGDSVCRFGGDEFAAIFRDAASVDDIDARSTALLAGLAVADENGKVSLRIGASLGYAFYPRDGDSLQTLLNAADAALYCAKADGKGRIKGCAIPSLAA